MCVSGGEETYGPVDAEGWKHGYKGYGERFISWLAIDSHETIV